MVTWAQLLIEFARAGNLTLGGGPSMMAELQTRLIQQRQWLPPEDFGLLYSISRVTPGTNILAFAAAAAARIRGPLAGVLAVFAASLPAALVIWLMTIFFDAWSANRWVSAIMFGAMAAVVALIVSSAWQLFQPFLRNPLAVALAIAALLAAATNAAGPVTILLCAAAIGALRPSPQ
ncbi:MAG TPA: chromate transporter [Bryobacteraceae bacterium]|nr:chromate transporter [Bryobacteraceae bacterium]